MKSLKETFSKAFSWDFTGTIFRQGSAFVISVLLARLLEPSEFGLVGMAMVFITISQVFVDVGFSAALIQKKTVNNIQLSSIFYMNIVFGVALTLIFYFIAPFIALFYENNEIVFLIRWLSLIFIFNAFSQVQIAILKRAMNFKLLTLRLLIASLLGGVIGIICAYNGFGALSLVWQQISTAFIGTFLLWSMSSWKPSFEFSFIETKKLTVYSSYIFFDSLSAQFFSKVDTLFIGKVFTPTVLGLYTRAESFSQIVNTFSSKSLNNTTFPMLSSIGDDNQRFNNVLFRLLELVCLVSFTLTGILYMFGAELILILFGTKWEAAIPIFEILVLRAATYPINTILLNGLKSKGFAKENFQYGLIRKLTKLLILLVAYFYGLTLFLWCFLAYHYAITIINNYWVTKKLGVDQLVTLRIYLPYILPFIILISINEYVQPEFIMKPVFVLLYVMTLFLSTYKSNNGAVRIISDYINNFIKK